jgi:hypothetical protein
VMEHRRTVCVTRRLARNARETETPLGTVLR